MGDGISFKSALVEYTDDASTYLDISGFMNTITVTGGDRATADFFSPGNATACLTWGKRASLNVAVNILYTEDDVEVAGVQRIAYEADHELNGYQWQPAGAGVGNFIYTTSFGAMLQHPYPGGDAGSADALQIANSIQCETITKTVEV